jgi:hypothetical protein
VIGPLPKVANDEIMKKNKIALESAEGVRTGEGGKGGREACLCACKAIVR